MTSIAASMATAKFNQLRMLRSCSYGQLDQDYINDFKIAMFDARVFQVPSVNEMVNVMIWRQQDATRNSISMAASEYFSHKSLEGVSSNDKQERLFQEKGINWNDYPVKFKRGTVIKKEEVALVKSSGSISNKTTIIDENIIFTRNVWNSDEDTPIFTQNKEYLSNLIAI
jgi:tRNA(His) 5'-end guanylyltransferase